MARPYVSAVTVKGDQLVLTVQLENFMAGQPVEVSGYATQNSGAFAAVHDLQTVGANPDDSVVMYVMVTPGKDFMAGEPVTVSLRAVVVKEWITVVAGAAPVNTPTKASDGTTWEDVTEVGWTLGGPSSPWSPGQAPADGDSNFQASEPG
jgi:hypothetical protein